MPFSVPPIPKPATASRPTTPPSRPGPSSTTQVVQFYSAPVACFLSALDTVSRVRHAGATGPLTMRADSGFYNHAIVADCRQMQVRYSITVRQHPSLRNLIEAIPEEDWAPIPYWMEGAADVAETEYTPFGSEPDAVPVRLIVRRVKPTPGSQLALMADYSYHAFITDRDGDTVADVPGNWRLTIDATPRSRTPSAISSTAWGSTIYPRGASPPTPPGWPSRAWPTTLYGT